ncbi:archaemetzincin family Zn-dependent metalloprotease [Candidatus Zixiibacteriota bacterium]
MPRLDLVPIFLPGRQEMIDCLIEILEFQMGLEVRQHRPGFDAQTAFDANRGQYNSTMLLRMLLEDLPGETDYILGICGVDLFIPVLTYVFGEAQLSGPAAVISIHRLDPAVYGLPADDDLLCERLKKEAIHELGHCFGLVHCQQPACVMRASTYVEDIDLKPPGFCHECARLEVTSSCRTSP